MHEFFRQRELLSTYPRVFFFITYGVQSVGKVYSHPFARKDFSFEIFQQFFDISAIFSHFHTFLCFLLAFYDVLCFANHISIFSDILAMLTATIEI